MIHLDEDNLIEHVGYLKRKVMCGELDRPEYADKAQHTDHVKFLMEFENDAVELHLSNLINTYGVGKVKKILRELTTLKKAV